MHHLGMSIPFVWHAFLPKTFDLCVYITTVCPTTRLDQNRAPPRGRRPLALQDIIEQRPVSAGINDINLLDTRVRDRDVDSSIVVWRTRRGQSTRLSCGGAAVFSGSSFPGRFLRTPVAGGWANRKTIFITPVAVVRHRCLVPALFFPRSWKRLAPGQPVFSLETSGESVVSSGGRS